MNAPKGAKRGPNRSCLVAVDNPRQKSRKHRSWRVTTKRRRSTRREIGSGNVFSDLGLKDADQLMARSQIGFHVFKILEEKKLKQRETAGILGIAQSDVSHLMNGHFSRFTTDKLLDFLRRLDQKVTIKIVPHKRGEPYQVIGFAS